MSNHHQPTSPAGSALECATPQSPPSRWTHQPEIARVFISPKNGNPMAERNRARKCNQWFGLRLSNMADSFLAKNRVDIYEQKSALYVF